MLSPAPYAQLRTASAQWQRHMAHVLNAAAQRRRTPVVLALLARLRPWEQDVQEVLTQWNGEEQEAVTTALSETDDLPVRDTPAHQHRLLQVLGIPLLRLFLHEWRWQGGTGPATRALLRPPLAHVTDASTSYLQTTQARLTQQVAIARKAGVSPAAVQTRVAAVYHHAATVRATQLAASETMRIAHAAQVAAQEDSTGSWIWRTTEDAAVCGFCRTLHGRRVMHGGVFAYEGDTLTTATGAQRTVDYGDLAYPPLHPHCRCTLERED